MENRHFAPNSLPSIYCSLSLSFSFFFFFFTSSQGSSQSFFSSSKLDSTFVEGETSFGSIGLTSSSKRTLLLSVCRNTTSSFSLPGLFTQFSLFFYCVFIGVLPWLGDFVPVLLDFDFFSLECFFTIVFFFISAFIGITSGCFLSLSSLNFLQEPLHSSSSLSTYLHNFFF